MGAAVNCLCNCLKGGTKLLNILLLFFGWGVSWAVLITLTQICEYKDAAEKVNECTKLTTDKYVCCNYDSDDEKIAIGAWILGMALFAYASIDFFKWFIDVVRGGCQNTPD
jgi:hypothetical protein